MCVQSIDTAAGMPKRLMIGCSNYRRIWAIFIVVSVDKIQGVCTGRFINLSYLICSINQI